MPAEIIDNSCVIYGLIEPDGEVLELLQNSDEKSVIDLAWQIKKHNCKWWSACVERLESCN